MLKTLMILFIISSYVLSQTPISLYSDSDLPEQNTPKQYSQIQSEEYLNKSLVQTNDTAKPLKSEKKKTSDTKINQYKKYINNVFKLSQQTHHLLYLSNESIIYSDISRLEEIIASFSSQLDNPHKITYTPIGKPSIIQKRFQKIILNLQILSPYISELLEKNYKRNAYLIQYKEKVTYQLISNIKTSENTKRQLNIGQQNGQLPFVPQNPKQLAFGLRNQVNSSILSAFGSNTANQSGNDPYSKIVSPANADLLNQNQNNDSNNSSGNSKPNNSPLGMMQYIPNF